MSDGKAGTRVVLNMNLYWCMQSGVVRDMSGSSCSLRGEGGGWERVERSELEEMKVYFFHSHLFTLGQGL